MNTLSATKLDEYLKEYALHLKYWEPNDGDGNELLGCRELLEQHDHVLTPAQQKKLLQLDQQAQQLWSDHKTIKGFDLVMLKKTVEIALGHQQAA